MPGFKVASGILQGKKQSHIEVHFTLSHVCCLHVRMTNWPASRICYNPFAGQTTGTCSAEWNRSVSKGCEPTNQHDSMCRGEMKAVC